MLAHAIEETDFAALDPADFIAEWKWDGIRVQAVAGRDEHGQIVARLYSRTGEDISKSFPDLVAVAASARRHRRRTAGAARGPGADLQRAAAAAQPQSRHAEADARNFPIHLRAYDLLGDGENDLRELPFAERRARLEAFVAKLDDPRIDLSPTVRLRQLGGAAAARADPASAGAGDDADAVEGVMLKRRDAPYVPGRPKGQWWKWKRDPHIIDAVLMYAQRGHGKRSSFYSDYTFGVWTAGDDGEQLVPVGKAYFGFTDEELLQIDRFVRRNTTEKFGPVRAGRARAGPGPGAGSRLRGLAALAAAQIRRRDAVSPHQPAALGQAAARGRPAGDAGADAEGRDGKLTFRRRMAAID